METFPVTCIADVEAYARKHCNDGQCWVISMVFGTAYATPYRYPSAIPYTCYSDTYQFDHKYWRNNAWISFPVRTIRKYESTGLGISD